MKKSILLAVNFLILSKFTGIFYNKIFNFRTLGNIF